MAYDNAAYLRDRYRLLRDLKVCIDCKGDAPHGSRCEDCRQRFNAKRRKEAA